MDSNIDERSINTLNSLWESYQPRYFDPFYLFSNAHFQTIVGSGALLSFFIKPIKNYQTKLETWNTPDGDTFDVQFVIQNADKNNIVIILHGLESTPDSPLVTSICAAMLRKDFACCLLSFRGCNGVPNATPGAYHVGFTADLRLLTERLHQRFPDKSIYLCGFSLGGNVILKFLGECGDTAFDLGIRGSAVTCVPFDPVISHKNIESGLNRAIYSEVSVSTMFAHRFNILFFLVLLFHIYFCRRYFF